MMNPFDYFDKIFCINLPHDFDRKEVMNKTFRDLGIYEKVFWCFADKPYEGYRATNYQYKGEFGVVLSQLKALVAASFTKVENGIAIFEDDVHFDENSHRMLQEALDNVPDDWDILYLGGRPLEKLEHVQGNIYKVNKFTSAMSYCISAKALRQYALFYIDRMGRAHPDACCDNILNDFIIHNGKNGYVMYPNLTLTIPGHSTLRNGYRDYRDAVQKSWDEHL